MQHLRAEVSQTSITQYKRLLPLEIRDLCRDLKSCRYRFGENCEFIREMIRNWMEICFRKCQIVSKGSVSIDDSENRSCRAMRSQAASARVTLPAGAIDFTDDTLPCELTVFGDTDKFVTEDTLKSHVSLHQLQIGFADTGTSDLDPDFALSRFGDGQVISISNLISR